MEIAKQTLMSDRVRSLLENFNNTVDQGLCPVEIYNDPEIYQLEMERVFSKCWLFVGHETEIPKPGDYVSRRIGNDPFILVRDENGEIRCLLNVCRHRGAMVCRAERGNTSHFRCPYHNWIFKNTGQWVGAPQKAKAYREINPDEWGLLNVPKLSIYHGMVFVCLDPNAPSLEEYLGDMRFYLDAIFGLHEGGMEVIGVPQRWRIRADWKSASENLTAGDNYHAPQLHRFDTEVGIQALLRGQEDLTRLFATESGHTGICSIPFVEGTIWGYPRDLNNWFQLDRLSPLQQEWVKNWPAIIVGIFPNFSVLRTAEKTNPDDDSLPHYPFTRIGVCNPVGPGELEFWNWFLEWKDVDEKYKTMSYRGGVLTFGTSGTFEQDDSMVWEGPAIAGSSVFARKQGLKFNFQMGVGNMSVSEIVSESEWPFPGTAVRYGLNERNQRTFHKLWLKYMLSE